MRTLLALALTSVLVLSACGSQDGDTVVDRGAPEDTSSASALPVDGKDPQQNLDNARTMWEQGGIDDYDWTVERLCYCPALRAKITVAGGKSASTESSEGDDKVAGSLGFSTMEQLFDRIEKDLEVADQVRATYDPKTGAVRRVVIDRLKGAVDDEQTFVVRSLRPAQ